MRSREKNRLLHAAYSRKHPLRSIYTNIKTRCTNSRCKVYYRYGGRGISLHPQWAKVPGGFFEFERWVMDNLGPRPEGMSLDRIDNDGNYEPGNLRWATQAQQAANRRKYHGCPTCTCFTTTEEAE